MKSAYHDPNPIVILEHKGLYWSKVPNTENARVCEPDKDYMLPFGKAALLPDGIEKSQSKSCLVITYGMGVHWALKARKNITDIVEILDLRTLYPLDEEMMVQKVKEHGKCLILTEEPISNSFARSMAGMLQESCFNYLDAPIKTIGAMDLPAIPINSALEFTTLPNSEKVKQALEDLLNY